MKTVAYDDYKFGSDQAVEAAQRKFYKEEKERLAAVKALADAKARGAEQEEIDQLQAELDKETKEAEVAHVEFKQEEIKNLFKKNINKTMLTGDNSAQNGESESAAQAAL